MVMATGAKGILFRSGLAKTGLYLVLYNSALTTDETLMAYDPDLLLPKNEQSWK
jgi:hypothetical protein